MTHGRHSKVRPHQWLAGGIAVILLLALLLANWWLVDGSGTQPAEAARGRPSEGAVTTAVDRVLSPHSKSPDDAVAAALESCRGMHGEQGAVLRSAGRSLGQWRTHVEAMNKLVAGDITLAQASTFWEQTREGAAKRIEQFTDADGTYVSSGASCPWVAAELRADDVSELRGCRKDTAARDDLLASARVAVTTWGHHVHDMERLRAGTLSPEEATQLWLRNWRKGVDELDDYWAKARKAGRTTC